MWKPPDEILLVTCAFADVLIRKKICSQVGLGDGRDDRNPGNDELSGKFALSVQLCPSRTCWEITAEKKH